MNLIVITTASSSYSISQQNMTILGVINQDSKLFLMWKSPQFKLLLFYMKFSSKGKMMLELGSDLGLLPALMRVLSAGLSNSIIKYIGKINRIKGSSCTNQNPQIYKDCKEFGIISKKVRLNPKINGN